MGDLNLLPDGAPGEHVRLALKLALLVQHLQRAEQVIGGIIRKGAGIATAVDQPEARGERVIPGVQLLLKGGKRSVINVFHLRLDELIHALTQAHHALDALPGRRIQVGLHHDGVLPVVDLAVHQGVGIVPDLRVGRQGRGTGFPRIQIGQGSFPVGAMDVLNGFMQLIRQACAFHRQDSDALPAILRGFSGQCAQDHLRVSSCST